MAITATWIGPTQMNLAGPDAGPGPGDVYDDEIVVSGLMNNLSATNFIAGSDVGVTLSVPGQSGIISNASSSQPGAIPEWGYGKDNSAGYERTSGYASLHAQADPNNSQALDLFFDPTEHTINPFTNTPTNSYTLKAQDQISVVVYYNAKTGMSDSTTITVPTGSTTATGPVLVPSYPTVNFATNQAGPLQVSGWAQATANYPGWTQFLVTGLPQNYSIQNAILSDDSGEVYGETNFYAGENMAHDPNADTSYGSANSLIVQPQTSTSALFYFPPARNELNSTLTLRLIYANSTTQSVVQFTGGQDDINAPIPDTRNAGGSITLTPTGAGGASDYNEINNALNAGYTTIYLADGPGNGAAAGTFLIDNTLTLTHAVTIEPAPSQSSQPTLEFLQDAPPAVPWLAAILIQSDYVKLTGFAISFLNNNIAWERTKARDPAIIATSVFSSSRFSFAASPTSHKNYYVGIDIDIENLAITDEPAQTPGSQGDPHQFDQTKGFYATNANIYINAAGTTSTIYPDLLAANLQQVDGGIFSYNVIAGGTVGFNGSWKIEHNKYTGAPLGGGTGLVFDELGAGLNDSLIDYNDAQQVTAGGRTYQFFGLTDSGTLSYNVTVSHNTAENGVGVFAGDRSPGGFGPPALTEFVQLENYSGFFEGKPIFVSGTSGSTDPLNGRILIIPQTASGGAIGPGDLVTILSGRDPSDLTDSNLGDQTGQYVQVAQVISKPTNGPIVLLLNQPLPPDPNPSFGYSIQVSNGHVKDTIDSNTFDLTGTFSHAISASGNDYDLAITNNTFTGGDQFLLGDGQYFAGGAISFLVYPTNPYGTPTDPEIFHTVFAGVTIDKNNEFINTFGGISVGFQGAGGGPETSFGRTCANVTIDANTFSWDPNFLSQSNFNYGKLTTHGTNNAIQTSYPYPSSQTESSYNFLGPIGSAPLDKNGKQIPAFDYPLLVPIAIAMSGSRVPANAVHTSPDDNYVPTSTQNLSFYPAILAGSSADPNGYFEGQGDFTDPREFRVTITSNVYTSAPSIPTFEAPKSVIGSAVINGNTNTINNNSYNTGNLYDDTTLVPYQAPSQTPSPAPGLYFQFAGQGDPVASGYVAVSNFTGYSSSQGYGWSATPNYDQNADPGSVYASDQTFQVALPNGYYDVTPTLGDPGSSASQGNINVVLQGGSAIDVVSYAAGQTVSPTYLALVTYGTLTLRVYEPGGRGAGVISLHSLTITPAATVVDDGQAGYSQAGDWTPYSGLGLNGELVYHSGGDATASMAAWAASGLAAGTYAVQADWNGYSGHSSAAAYMILVNGVSMGTYYEDQRAASTGGPAAGNLAFQTIATVSAPAGATIKLVLVNGGGGDVVAARFAPM